ncbi:MAG: CopG family transcriptional regulator [Thermoplasmata archaeon]|nr:MAG: CopG family transcriptional regulator [Thermoplasmata archaeon]
MEVISVRLPDEWVQALDQLVEKRVFLSRSEAVRYAIALLITRVQRVAKKAEDPWLRAFLLIRGPEWLLEEGSR